MIAIRKFIPIVFLFVYPLFLNAQKTDSVQHSTLVFSLPLVDLPYQIDAAKTVNGGSATFGSFFKGYTNPGMHQSIELSTDLYTGLHYGIKCLFKDYSGVNVAKNWKPSKLILYDIALAGSDLLFSYFPGFNIWTHEEYHRSVLGRFHVKSYDDVNRFPIGSSLISVSHVADEDLIRFKKESPADFIRMHTAGIEGDYQLIDRLERNNFFYRQDIPHEFLYLVSTINSIYYVMTCSNAREADKMTDELNAKEGTIAVRDFTGLDFDGWVYDLFRPDEPYEARGIHPSGTGIDRYIKTTDLTKAELSYLKKQGRLQWINVVSPMLFFIREIKLNNKGLYGNLALHHYLTSFGNDVSCTVFLRNPRYKSIFTFHSYQNYERSFPAIEAQLIDLEKNLGKCSLYFSPRLLVGMQPLNQGFRTKNSGFLGLAECRASLESRCVVNPFVELSAKTKGWVAGNEYLSDNLSFRFGVTSRLTSRR